VIGGGERARVDPSPGFSQAVRAGSIVVVSGQVAWGSGGEVVGEGDSAAQATQVFANLTAVLEQAGARLDDVVKLTCFLTDASHFDGYARVKANAFPDAGPASTTVIVDELLDERLLLEVEAMAVIR
jgi:enamine deaminase RidA (YjgF/YER057c/UK114 family)